MPLALLLISLILISFSLMMSTSSHQVKKWKQENGDYNSSSRSFINTRGMHNSFNNSELSFSTYANHVENIETALIRTCRSTSTLAHANNCIGWDKASIIWNFVGTSGGTGTLNVALTGTTTNIFTCASIDDFGRGLFQQSLPPSYSLNFNLLYDFTGMNDNNVDPCGYSDIIRR